MADGKTPSKFAKWAKTAKFLLYLATPCLLQIITILGLKLFIPPPPPPPYNNGGPEFQIYSASLSTFSTFWWSQTITAGWNISLSAKSQLGDEKISHDLSEVSVSVSHNDTRLSWKMYPSFLQVPSNDQLFLDVDFPHFPVKIDASVADFIWKEKRFSVDVVILGTISNEDGHESKTWSKNFTAICKKIELQLLPSKIFSRSQKAEMINEGPIKCESLWKIDFGS